MKTQVHNMKFIIFIFVSILSLQQCIGEEITIESFLQNHPRNYQDIIVNNQVVATGTDLCSPRYKMIQPILDSFQRPFTVLDLGAAQGYFSYRIAHDYPLSSSVMIDANTSYYGQHGDVLYELCQLNRHLNNICYLNRAISISDLKYLNKNEHFDVLIAFLVVHLMQNELKDQIKVIEQLLQLSDNLLIEIASDVGVILSAYVEYLSTKLDCQYLGEVTRHTPQGCPFQNETSCPCRGKLFWFRTKPTIDEDGEMKNCTTKIKKETFQRLNGMYP